MMHALNRYRSPFERVVRSTAAASLASVLAAAIEAGWDRHNTVVPFAALFAAEIGLLTPLGFAIGLAVGIALVGLWPYYAPSPSTMTAELRRQALGRPAEMAAFIPLTVVATLFWATCSAHSLSRLLALGLSTTVTGIAAATSCIGLGVLLGLVVLAITPPLRHVLANASSKVEGSVDPVLTGLVALLTILVLVSYGVSSGTVSGEGGFLAIFGVLKRPELDLRGPVLILAVCLAAAAVPALPRIFPLPIVILVGCSPLLFTVRASNDLNHNEAVLDILEKSSPLGRPMLTALRRTADSDRDGYSPLFGGGDCDDTSARIYPLAVDVPDNGVDEDCALGDLSSKAVAANLPVAATDAHESITLRDANLVLITVDTLRADLGYAGYPRPVSPNLDALAARSTVFERAYSLASYTGKSVGPMLIGKYGSETHRNWGHFNKFSQEDIFLSERLKGAGISTMSVHAHRYFGKFGGLDRGFDVVDLSSAPPEGAAWDVDNEATSERLSNAAIKLLEDPGRTDKRFFLWVHYLDPHADYLRHPEVPAFGKTQRDLYDGEVAFTDRHIGRLLNTIEKAPWGNRTIIVVTSDHGEAFGEHKMYRHGFEVWEELVRVPFLVHVPSVAPNRVSERRSLIDLVPTALELMGVPLPKNEPGSFDFVSGVSLVPDLLLKDGKGAQPRDILVDMPAGPYNEARQSFIHKDMKLTISGGTRFELYDLAKDPGEQTNLWSTQRSAIEPLYAARKSLLREIRVTAPKN